MSEPSCRPSSISAAVGGVLGAVTSPPIEALGGMSAGFATKSYTQIRLGRGRPGLLNGVWLVTFVEAQPATTTTAIRHNAIRLKRFITNPSSAARESRIISGSSIFSIVLLVRFQASRRSNEPTPVHESSARY